MGRRCFISPSLFNLLMHRLDPAEVIEGGGRREGLDANERQTAALIKEGEEYRMAGGWSWVTPPYKHAGLLEKAFSWRYVQHFNINKSSARSSGVISGIALNK